MQTVLGGRVHCGYRCETGALRLGQQSLRGAVGYGLARRTEGGRPQRLLGRQLRTARRPLSALLLTPRADPPSRPAFLRGAPGTDPTRRAAATDSASQSTTQNLLS